MRIVLAAAAMAILGGCAAGSGNVQQKPASIGGGPNQLRRAPCACVLVPNKPGLPSHLQSTDNGTVAA